MCRDQHFGVVAQGGVFGKIEDLIDGARLDRRRGLEHWVDQVVIEVFLGCCLVCSGRGVAWTPKSRQ